MSMLRNQVAKTAGAREDVPSHSHTMLPGFGDNLSGSLQRLAHAAVGIFLGETFRCRDENSHLLDFMPQGRIQSLEVRDKHRQRNGSILKMAFQLRENILAVCQLRYPFRGNTRGSFYYRESCLDEALDEFDFY